VKLTLLLATVLFLGCGGSVTTSDTPAGPNDEVPLEATVSAYSGRPNPTLTLRADEVKDMRTRIQALSSAAAPENFPKLGELSLVVENNGKVPSLPDRIVTGRNLVGLTSKSKTTWFNDEKQLGPTLTNSARAAGVLPQ